MSERDVQNRILLELGRGAVRLWRQNVGLGWVGKLVHKSDTEVVLRHPRPLHAGLCEGSSDIIGLTMVEITPEMVGRRVAVFTSLEVKHGRRGLTDEQADFLQVIERAGGIAAEVRSPDDARAVIESWKTGKSHDSA